MKVFLLVVYLLLEWEGGGAIQCDRSLGQVVPKTKADGRFLLVISGDPSPSTYHPSETYTVKLVGIKSGSMSARFLGFSLSVEGSGGNSNSRLASSTNPGSFVLFGDAITRFSQECPSVVIHTAMLPKNEVQVMWTAPPPGHGCVTFKATVIEQTDLWYQDEPPLSRTLCEDSLANEEETTINQQCCACDEAKYEMTFEGLWSRHTHPKDFPSNLTATRFSDVIGASHTTDYRFWEYSGIASEGLKMMAERGSTRLLESELKSESQNIRTIIKARGISYPNVTGKTFAVFRVDNRHHLISVVSMLDPSPDWIVGVSAFELCLPNCTWLENKVINLFPWDAGTDSGITYTSPDMPTQPRDHIRRITSSFPSDPRSPFYDPSGEDMKPLARLYLTRQRLYEKSCEDSNIEYQNNEICEVGPWTDWSPCSASCGAGKKTKQRFYKNQDRAETNGCNKELTRREVCYGPRCPDLMDPNMNGGGDSGIINNVEQCAMSEWSPWSGCSVSCGKGEKHRFRGLVNNNYWKSCMGDNNLVFRQDAECIGEEGEACPPVEHSGEMAAALRSQCEVGMWSEWSPCSVSCGNGTRIRVRELKDPLYQGLSRQQLEIRCAPIQTQEKIPCRADIPTCKLSPHEAKDDTTEHLFGGINSESLQGHTSYPVTGAFGPVIDCKVSGWSSWSPCSVTCGRGLRERTRFITAHAKNGGKVCPKKLLKRRRCNAGPCPGSRGEDRDEYDDDDSSVARDTNCIYNDWGPWSRCSASCGENAVQQRTRSIDLLKTSQPAYCTDRLQTRVCNFLPPCRRYYYYRK